MKLLSSLLFAVVALPGSGSSVAQSSFPEKPVRVVIGFPAGSGIDIIARLFSQRLGEALAKAVVVENVTGAAGNIATERVVRAAPDGYTLALASQGQIVINPMLYKLSFEPAKDLMPVSQVFLSSNLLVVNNAFAAKNVQELVQLARARPGEITFATGGSGSSPHLAGSLFKTMAGIDIREIPYKGVNAAIPDVLGGRVVMMFSPIAEVLTLVRDGKLRALAVTSPKRSPALPELLTVDEAGIRGFDATSWGGLFAPAGTAPPIVRKLHQDTVKALAQADVRTRFADIGIGSSGSSPEEFAAVIKSDGLRWPKVFKDVGVKPEQ